MELIAFTELVSLNKLSTQDCHASCKARKDGRCEELATKQSKLNERI